MIKSIYRSAAFMLAIALTMPYSLPVAAQITPANEEALEEVFVLGMRRAYQGNFDLFENPSAVQLIDEQLLREAGAINLNRICVTSK